MIDSDAITYNYFNGLLKSRPLFFLAIIFLTTNLPKYFTSLNIVLTSIALFYIGLEFVKNDQTFNRIILLFLSTFLIFASENNFVYTFIAVVFFRLFFVKYSGLEFFSWSTAACLPIIILLIETAQYYGMPFGIFFIWGWGIGFLVAAILFQVIFKHKSFYIVCIICSLLFFTHQFAQIFKSGTFTVITEKPINNEYAKTFSVVSSSIKYSKNFDTGSSGSLIVPLPENPAFNEIELINRSSSDIFMFAEHGDIEKFKSAESQFNNDEYKRKTPWILYRPMFRKELELSSNKDSLYCSNIGCTVKKNIFHYPITWDYNQWGVPIILASGNFSTHRRVVYYGDSDPIVSFLIPYNAQFLRSLFSIFDYRLMLEILPIIFFSLLLMLYQRKSLIIISFALVSLSIHSGSILPPLVHATAEFDVRTDLKIHSPHYDDHFSSLPAQIAKQGHTVSINSQSKDSIPIYIVDGKNSIKIKKTRPAIFFLLENSEIEFDEILIGAANIPLGLCGVNINGKKAEIYDGRNIIYNGHTIDNPIFVKNQFIFVATESPQLNANLIIDLKDTINHKF